MQKIGFLGCGNMASAIIGGAVGSKFLKGNEISVFDIDSNKANALTNAYGVKACDSAKSLAEECEYVVLAVKPQVFPAVLPQIADYLNEGSVVISIGAGKTTEFIESFLKENTAIVRVMPNINAKVSASMSAVCRNTFVDDEAFKFVKSLCTAFGDVIELDESQFPIFGVIAGCSPAYAFMFIDAMASEAQKHGISKEDALKICEQAVLGSAKMMLADENNDPWALIKSVCSPGGTTIEGVNKLQEESFSKTVMSAVKASFDKDKKL